MKWTEPPKGTDLGVAQTQDPHSHILMTGGGRGVGPKNFFGSEILAKREFL